MPPATLHGITVITTKLYFVIFAAFTEWVSLTGHSMQSKTVYKRVRLYICHYTALTVSFALCSTVTEILPVLYAHGQFFPTPLLFWLKLEGVPFGIDPSHPWCCGLQKEETLVQSFVILLSKNSNYVTTVRTDRRTDIQLATATPRSSEHRAVIKRKICLRTTGTYGKMAYVRMLNSRHASDNDLRTSPAMYSSAVYRNLSHRHWVIETLSWRLQAYSVVVVCAEYLREDDVRDDSRQETCEWYWPQN